MDTGAGRRWPAHILLSALIASSVGVFSLGGLGLFPPLHAALWGGATQTTLPTVKTVVEAFFAEITAYSSTPEETDSTPFISADGNRVYDGLIACPRRYQFGTMVRISGTLYRCGDRLHPKNDHRFDVWKATKDAAIHFGKQVLYTEIVELSPPYQQGDFIFR